jgi:DNA invertase Pin-like site-specific DNA recombinase
MRYGVVRVSPDLPPPNLQRRLIEAVGCDVVLEERPPSAYSQRNLFQLLYGLKAGDELLVHSLSVLAASTGELARLMRHLLETGVTLRITGGSRLESLAPDGSVPRALAMLADHESARRAAKPDRHRPRSKGTAPLTQHQLKFARDMHRRGHSMREIGLLFQLAPMEIAGLIRGQPRAPASDGSPQNVVLADSVNTRPIR